MARGVNAPDMTRARDIRPDRRDLANSIVCVDGFVRPRSVPPERKGPHWNRLKHVQAGIDAQPPPNAVFDAREALPACKTVDATRCFVTTGLDAMALWPTLVET